VSLRGSLRRPGASLGAPLGALGTPGASAASERGALSDAAPGGRSTRAKSVSRSLDPGPISY